MAYEYRNSHERYILYSKYIIITVNISLCVN